MDQLLPMSGGSVFFLARMAMLRALEINLGSPPLVKFSLSEKETTIALREIAQGKVSFKGGPVAAGKVEHVDEALKDDPSSEDQLVLK